MVSQKSRFKGLLGPVSRIIKKKKDDCDRASGLCEGMGGAGFTGWVGDSAGAGRESESKRGERERRVTTGYEPFQRESEREGGILVARPACAGRWHRW